MSDLGRMFFQGNRPFGAFKTRKIFWPAGACHPTWRSCRATWVPPRPEDGAKRLTAAKRRLTVTPLEPQMHRYTMFWRFAPTHHTANFLALRAELCPTFFPRFVRVSHLPQQALATACSPSMPNTRFDFSVGKTQASSGGLGGTLQHPQDGGPYHKMSRRSICRQQRCIHSRA